MLGNFVFDIDGAMAIAVDYEPLIIAEKVKKEFGELFYEEYCLEAYNYPHYIFPGYYALLKWLHGQGGKIFFFSSGIEERNVELAKKVMAKTFAEDTNVGYKVFSRKHCIDTTRIFREEDKIYQSYFYGQRKKKLSGIVVPDEEIVDTLLIDDDTSYMVKGEEFNFISLPYTHQYLQSPNYPKEAFMKFHKPYYLAGLFSEIFAIQKTKNLSLRAAARYVQIDKTGALLNRDFRFPTLKDWNYYKVGLAILRKIDPTLKFFCQYPV